MANVIRGTKGTQKFSHPQVEVIRKTKAWIESYVRVGFEFNGLRVQTGDQPLGLIKPHCVDTWGEFLSAFQMEGCVQMFLMWRTLVFDFITSPLPHWSLV